MGLEKLVDEIKRNKSFLITSHVNLEGDALGSELAMCNLLKSLGKRAVIVNDDVIPEEYKFLPGAKKVKRMQQIKEKPTADVFLALDCSDLARCRAVSGLSCGAKIILNIDHHISNSYFGKVNWVDPQASSASEMIYELYKKMQLPLNKEAALCIYVGMLTDTGSFHYPNTTARSIEIVAEIVGKFHLNASKIYKGIYESIPLADIKILSRIISEMDDYLGGRIICFEVKEEMFRAHKLTIDLTEQVLNFGRLVKEAEVVVLFKENLSRHGQVRVNFRSRNVDVNKIAQAFGGGGHKNASGATINGQLAAVRRKVLEKIKKQL